MVYKEIDIYLSPSGLIRRRYLLTLFRKDFKEIPEIGKLSAIIEKALEEPFVKNIKSLTIDI